MFIWSKIKFKHLGEQGVTRLKYDYDTGRFAQTTAFDKSNWLTENVKQQVMTYNEPEKKDFTWERDENTPPF